MKLKPFWRKTFSFVLCLVMLISFFNIGRIFAEAEKFELIDASIVDKSEGLDASIASFDNNDVNINATFHKVNDYISYKLTIRNNDDEDYTIKTIKDNNRLNTIVYEYDKHENEPLVAGGTIEVTIKATYKNSVTDMSKRDQNDSVKLTFVFLDENGEEDEINIDVNPKTFDNIYIYVGLIVLSIFGLSALLVNKNSKKSKKARQVIIFLAVILPLLAKAASFNFVASFNNDIGLYDKMVVTKDIDGTLVEEIVPYSETFEVPDEPQRDGYNFVGWNYNGQPFDFNTEITEDIVLEAVYELIPYTITYDLDNGNVEGSNPTEYNVETNTFTLINPTKEGYNFTGWTYTGVTTPQLTVTITKGSTGDKSFTANYTERDDIAYKVKHMKMNITGSGYEEAEVENLTGKGNSNVTPSVKTYTGFTSPETQTKKIELDGSTEFTYEYTRNKYNLTVNNREFVTSASTADGEYYYETPITLSALDRQGYTFSKWSNGLTDQTIQFNLSGETTISPEYTANTNTIYKVIHKKMNVTGDDYEVAETQVLTGTTGAEITPAVKNYDHFTSPSTQTTTINADGSTEVVYEYERDKYTFSIADRTYVTSASTADGEYYYETPINASVVNRAGYTFSKWSNNLTDQTIQFNIEEDTELSYTYSANTNTAYKVIHKKMNVTGDDYEVAETENLTGTTGAEITPAVKNYDHFTSPSTQTTTISGDGDTEVIYEYVRDQYTFEISDRTYVDSSSTADGTYYYGTQITAKAVNRPGFTFEKWSNNITDQNATFELSENTSISPSYIASGNTAYKVIHKKMNKTGDGYVVAETENLTGETGAEITPAVKNYEHFTSPSTQTTTISGDGDTEVVYEYVRDQYTFEISDRTYVDSSSTADGTYYYETEITAKVGSKPGYTFTKWSDNSTDSTYTFEISGNTSLSPVFTANTNTLYTVIHKKMNTDGTTYTEEETEELYGTTDSEVTPAVKHYDHFTSPSVKTDTINGDGSTVFEYLYSRDQYTLNVTDRTYVTAASSENGDYYYDEQITLSAVNRPGYTFSKWSNELTTQTIQFNISEDIEIYPIYTANTNTPYKVKHYKMDVDGVNYTLEETENLTGTTDTSVTPAVKNYTHFTSPTTQTDSIDGSGETVFEYYYTRDQYSLNVTDRTYVSSTSTANGTYYYETPITLTAVDRTGFEFTKWSNDETSQTYEFNISSNVTIYPIYTEVVVNQFTVTLNANGGTVDPTFIKVNEGSPVGVLPIPTNDDSTQEFDGWYTLSEGGDSVTSGFTPTADIEIFAHWTTVSRPLLCKKATDLHTENCNSTSGQGCLKAGFALDSPIRYGRLSVDSTYQPGDVFNCDVNGDGTYDSETERFYYMRTVDDKAVLIYYTNFEGTNGPGVTENTVYDTALTKLPVIDPDDAHTWKNVDVTFGDYAARFPTREDFYAACGSNDLSSEGSLDACKFVMENTRFAYNENVTPTHRTAIWLQKEDNTLYRYMNSTRNVVSQPSTTSKNAARPVIEVSTSLMDTAPAYTITLNVNGGYGVPSEIIMFGGSVVTAETLPTPQRDLYDFVGWYSALDGGVECTPGYVVNSSMEIFARWQKKPTVTISFNSNGGEELDSIDVVQGQPVGALPIPEYAGYTLEGWYTEPELENKVDSTFSTTSNVTLYAKWEEDVSNYVAVMNGTYYETVASALTASPNNTKTTIKMIADSTETISIGSNKNIVLDLHNHTLSSGGKTITNSGTLEVKDGNLGSSANNIISSTGTVKVNNVIATSTAGSGAFDNDGGTMTIIDSRVYNNNNRQAVYNNGGTLYIQGNTYLYSKADRASLHNLNGGTTYLQSGTVESDSTCNDKCGAIYNELGTVVIGHNRDETVSTTNPVIKGKNVAVRNNSTLRFYDGIIKALTTLITDKTDYEIEDDCTELEGTETIGSDTYHTLTLSYSPTHYKILLEADGGIVSPTQFYVDIGQSIGDAIGELPIPTKGVYHFDGWYTGEDVLVTSATIPTENDTFYAHWSYNTSNEPVQFNLTNDVMSVYYQNIDTWKDLSESDFYTAMKANFDNYNCSVCEAENACNNPSSGERCDHPKGYSTGITDDLVVYTYNNNQKSEYPVTYTTSTNGVIYNMIPGETYYWESTEDSNINGLVAVSGNRRTIYTPIKNVRDLGGLRVSYTVDNVTTTGTTKYERLYRGAQLSTSQSDADSLTKLGIDREIDLRSIGEGYSKGQAHLSKYDIDNPNATNGFDDIIIQNYLINPEATSYISSVNTGNYRTFKAALKATMRSIVNDENVFFHCTIGSDRTGTMAYFLEGLLGVSEEDRVQDYELSFFFGMVNRHRFHNDLVNTSIRPRFKAMHLSYPTNADIYNWYKYEPEADDDTLLEQFREAMIIKDKN